VLVKLEGVLIRELQSIKHGLAMLDERYVGDESEGNGVAPAPEVPSGVGGRAQL
jgi:hypothetical protein